MPASSSHSSSSESSVPPSRPYHKRRGKHRSPRTTSSTIRSSPSTSSASTTSPPSSSSESTTTESDSEHPSTDSSESTVTHFHRICHGRLPKSIKHRSQLPDYNTLMTRYISPERYSSSDASSLSDSSDDTSSSITVSSSSGSKLSSDSESTTSTNSASSSSIASSSTTTALPPHITQSSLPAPSHLHSRLSNFLPTIRASNAELERERSAGTLNKRNIENLSPLSDGESSSSDEEEKPYIEMDLGLGVLEEKKGAGDITPSGIKRARSRESEIRRSAAGEGVSPLEALMGRRGGRTPEARERKRRKVGIEVVD
ncbi:MAG: hypothetical protein L6R42_004838 [Xanthoria sp. 1 TBL-2021]|nr:MAG: hypothetical protein L6R42_004838 [Xanthoria sp. 1 TBL-2021]